MKDLENYTMGATDGDIGHVKDFYFDDDVWVVRYLVVDTGSWLADRKVLISPLSIHNPEWESKRLPVAITKDQVKHSPDIDTDKPVSRQHEMNLLGYYGYPYYWGRSNLLGGSMSPYSILPGFTGVTREAEEERAIELNARAERALHQDDDPHLRSCKAIIGYHIKATDGEIGHVEGLLIDEQTWAIQYLVVNTSNWWLGHKVLIAPEWIDNVSWLDNSVSLDLTREAVKTSPAYDSTVQLNREREYSLYSHYGRTGYWDVQTTVIEIESGT
ncbi:MAG: PRC-barrel domain-containing protein [Pseudomonas sp.]